MEIVFSVLLYFGILLSYFLKRLNLENKLLSNKFEKLNVLNKQLQGKDFNLISCKCAVTVFLKRLQLYKNNIEHLNIYI